MRLQHGLRSGPVSGSSYRNAKIRHVPRVSSLDTSLKRPTIVGLVVKPIGKPSAGNRHARFDERRRCKRLELLKEMLPSVSRVAHLGSKDWAELLSLRSNIILANTALALQPLKNATDAIPIVFLLVYDPVTSGFVSSLAHPRGNITGSTLGEFSLGGKMMECLNQVAPEIDHVSVGYQPQSAAAR